MAFTLKLRRRNIRKMLRGPEIQKDIKRRADNIAAAAGDGMVVTTGLGPNRARVSVGTDTHEAMLAEAKDRVLTRAIDAGRR